MQELKERETQAYNLVSSHSARKMAKIPVEKEKEKETQRVAHDPAKSHITTTLLELASLEKTKTNSK